MVLYRGRHSSVGIAYCTGTVLSCRHSIDAMSLVDCGCKRMAQATSRRTDVLRLAFLSHSLPMLLLTSERRASSYSCPPGSPRCWGWPQYQTSSPLPPHDVRCRTPVYHSPLLHGISVSLYLCILYLVHPIDTDLPRGTTLAESRPVVIPSSGVSAVSLPPPVRSCGFSHTANGI